MSEAYNLKYAWTKVGGIAGLMGGFSYFSAAFIPMPESLVYIAAFAFGPLLAIGAVGLYHCLSVRSVTPSLQIAMVSAVAGGVTVLIMLTTQQSIFGVMSDLIAGSDNPVAIDTFKNIRSGLHSVHWGMDVAWDVLICVAVILFSLNMFNHPMFGRIIAAVGVISGGLLLVFNLYYFPEPPISVDSIDWGPLVAVWLLAVFVMLLRASGWVKKSS